MIMVRELKSCCPCSKCKIKGRKIDCLCCKEVSGFVGEIRRGEHYMHYRKKLTNSVPFFKLHLSQRIYYLVFMIREVTFQKKNITNLEVSLQSVYDNFGCLLKVSSFGKLQKLNIETSFLTIFRKYIITTTNRYTPRSDFY